MDRAFLLDRDLGCIGRRGIGDEALSGWQRRVGHVTPRDDRGDAVFRCELIFRDDLAVRVDQPVLGCDRHGKAVGLEVIARRSFQIGQIGGSDDGGEVRDALQFLLLQRQIAEIDAKPKGQNDEGQNKGCGQSDIAGCVG